MSTFFLQATGVLTKCAHENKWWHWAYAWWEHSSSTTWFPCKPWPWDHSPWAEYKQLCLRWWLKPSTGCCCCCCRSNIPSGECRRSCWTCTGRGCSSSSSSSSCQHCRRTMCGKSTSALTFLYYYYYYYYYSSLQGWKVGTSLLAVRVLHNKE